MHVAIHTAPSHSAHGIHIKENGQQPLPHHFALHCIRHKMSDPIANLTSLIATATQLCRRGHGIIAADESVGTIGKRLQANNLVNDAHTRRTLRSILINAPKLEGSISGIILHDETIRQTTRQDNIPFAKAILNRGILPGIKVDQGLKPLNPTSRETTTSGLNGLQQRCEEYYQLGARFAKWRAAVRIDDKDGLPTKQAVEETAKTLGEYAELALRGGLVPIVEPEVLIEGDYDAGRAREVGAWVVGRTFEEIGKRGIPNAAVVVKMMMVTGGVDWRGANGEGKVDAKTVGRMTAELVREVIPNDCGGIVFLSGGFGEVEATENLHEVNVAAEDLRKKDEENGKSAWNVNLGFSFGRALQTSVVEIWKGRDENMNEASDMGGRLARVNAAAARGEYDKAMGHPSVVGGRGLTETFRGWSGSATA